MRVKVLLILFISFFLTCELIAQEKEKPSTVSITASTYKKETGKGIVLVDYWAAWCPPCQKMNPVLEELAKEYKGKVKIAKLDIDSNKQFATRQGIQSIPTMILYRDGKEIGRAVGIVSKQELAKALDEQLAEAARTNRSEDKE
ncbi:thioredoxin [Dysgonomonas sp. 25]|uniref:thioredoxin n=1 Tax=Dysgonomonas sp. 25 TaxID=2302933 RepID=UPI0013CF7F43|nr:thioredoxin [Dysgonomonas sp. 25]NDV70104.1 thioredoxin [Dysgonomonas sp. 25]